MKSSTGVHYIALDHVRALAAFMVFTWHFTHGQWFWGYPVHHRDDPIFLLALLDEGHTGVALFMTLSGYLFAKLLDGKSVNYAAFIWNRVLRLAPLLALVIAYIGVGFYQQGALGSYAQSIARGFIYPTLPNGGWSITAEFHFYLVLPLLLWMLRKSAVLPFAIIAAAITLRLSIYNETGSVQWHAYWTIIGRIDQFVFGVLAFHFRRLIAHRHAVAIGIALAISLFYSQFGYYMSESSPMWIIVPTIEGFAYGAVIAWYDSSFAPRNEGVSKFIAEIGEYSYSIYLLHFLIVFHLSGFIDHVIEIHNVYFAILLSLVSFLVVMRPMGYLSYRFIERPFLRLRVPYLRSTKLAAAAKAA